MASQHYTWEGAAPYMVNGPAVQGKLKTAVNSYCGNIIGNWGCSMCHVGVGKRPDDATLTTQQHQENIDCLICHQKDYKRKKDTLTGLMVPDTANMTITMDQAVQTVHMPVRQNCTQCHAKGGGGDNFKRGDLAVAHGTTADRNFDVHMAASTNGNFACQKCHTTQLHKIAGRGSDLRQTDLDVKMSCSTASCHSTKSASNGHVTTGVNKHVNRVACQTCHIPKSAKNAADTAATEATEMNRDWSTPEWHVANNRWEPTVTLANDIKPQYKFWNGTSWGYSLKDPAAIDPAKGKYPTSRPVGTIAGTDSSKLFPFKYKTAHRPYATNLGILIPIETKTYFAGAGTAGGVEASILSSLTLMGYSNTEPYTWVDDDTYQLLTHEVPPATGNVLACTNCHISTTATQMNLQSLGYAIKKPTSDLCNDCHGSQSYTSSYNSFTSIHSRHVDSLQRKCSNCHNFDRPERTNLR
jgi:nitrate reductase cytochrome c-type subunit